MPKLSIKTINYFVVSLIILIVTTMSALSIWQNKLALDILNSFYDEPFNAVNSITQIRKNSRIIWENTNEVIFYNSDINESKIKIQKLENDIESNFAVLNNLYLISRNDLDIMQSLYESHKKIVNNAIKIKETQGMQKAAEYIKNSNALENYKNLIKNTDIAMDYAQNSASHLKNSAHDRLYAFAVISFGIAIAIFIITFITSWFALLFFNKRFKELNDVLRLIDNGVIQTLEVDDNDIKEFKDIKISVNAMVARLDESYKTITNQAKELDDSLTIAKQKNRELEEVNNELDASYEELERTNEMLIEQARRLEESNTELEASYEEAATINSMLEEQKKLLIEKDEKLSSMYLLSPFGIALTDLNGKYLEFNPEFARICGYTKEELSMLDYWQLTPKKYEQDELKQIELLNTTGRYGPYEKEYIQKDGTLIPISLRGMLITDSHGQKFVWSIVEDITQKLENERVLKDSETKLKQAQQIANIGNWNYYFLENRFEICNKTLEIFDETESKDYSLEDFIAKLHIDDVENVRQHFRDAIENSKSYDIVYRIVAKDKTIKYIHAIGKVIYNDDLAPISVTGTVQDITERQKTNELQKALLNNNAVCIFLASDDRKIIMANERASEMFGYSKNELEGSEFSIVHINKQSFLDFASEYNKFKTEGSTNLKYRFRKKDGTILWCSVSGAPLDKNDLSKGIIWTLVDITKMVALEENLQSLVDEETRKRVEKEHMLMQQTRLATMGEMIGNIAHQWRQPLNQISALKDSIVDDYYFKELDDDKIESFNVSVENGLRYMSQTIDDFRNFFKPDKEKHFFDIKDSINITLSLVKDAMKSSFVNIYTNFTDEEVVAFGYKNEFTQVLINILNNARDVLRANNSDNNRFIDMSVKKDENSVIVSISDNAGGVPEHIMQKIFDPYFTTKHASQGTGLGLYMSKMIIEQNLGGKLSVSNTQSGACFSIELNIKK